MSTSTAPAGQDWVRDAQGRLRYAGPRGEIQMPDTTWMIVERTFADGFRCGRSLCQQQPDGTWLIATDTEFSALIAQHQPQALSAHDSQEWQRGFMFGWVMTWYEPLQRV
ncbi:MAG TPA: hypothetical protein VFA10_16720 [Ktedonobacteraceae bacterium]|nr:hypothetical protein [Ktedonobacteraceae bacterium]